MKKFGTLFFLVFILALLAWGSVNNKSSVSILSYKISDSTDYDNLLASVNENFLLEKRNNKHKKIKQHKISWADSVYRSLSPEERLGQLFMVAAWSNKDQKHREEIEQLICDYHIGGLMFMQGGPHREAVLCNNYQALSKTPLLISIDAEWGLAMRLDSVSKYPKQMTLGAIQNDSLVYEMGVQIAKDCKRLGIQVNFAPVVDINSNPENPVIGYRSFGENKFNVASKGLAYMQGMQSLHVLSNAKHFPGHGDTDTDSHKSLPIINHSRQRMDTLELYPFKKLINNGLASIMVGHLNIPAYDTATNCASSLSPAVVNGLLKDSLHFKGLVFTDALNMKGVSCFYKPGVVDAKALLAGNDVLLFAEDVPTAIQEIKNAIDSCEISWSEVYERCYKILKAKEWAGLNHLQPIQTENIYRDLNSKSAELLNRKLYESALTLLTNQDQIVPIKRLDTLKIASLSIGDTELNTFQKTLENYTAVKHFNIPNETKKSVKDSVLNELKKYNLVLACIVNTNVRPNKNFGISSQSIEFIDSVNAQTNLVLTVFANPSCLSKFKNPRQYKGLLIGYEEVEYAEKLCAQLIFGGATSKGKLGFSIPGLFKAGEGIDIGPPTRFSYVLPEEVNIKSEKLGKIDTLTQQAIDEKAIPGCQILVAKDGKIFYNKSFGNTDYTKNIAVDKDLVYDLASVTKVSSTLLALMKLYDAGKFPLDSSLSYFLPELKKTNKGNLIVRDILTHQARLKAWIPFWKSTFNNGKWKTNIYSKIPTPSINTRVADSLFVINSFKDSIFKSINNSELEPTKKYLYSDLGYYYFKKIIETKTADSIQNYVGRIYRKLGMNYTGYMPLSRIQKNKIAPTELDTIFRKQLIQGYVHDQGAALLGGIGGHAGVFSNANDLAKLMQMYLNNGSYGGEQYIQASTMQTFTDCQFCDDGNRRAIGFDKPEPNPEKESPCCKCVSLLSFGHTGFTGTMVWIDPQYNLVYIFLSNRINPSSENKKLIQLGLRTKVQQVIYEALK